MGLIELDVREAGEAPALIRPRLLVTAARHGAALYLGQGRAPLAARERARLAEAERQMEDLRRRRSALYRPGRHVEALAILLAEAGRDAARA